MVWKIAALSASGTSGLVMPRATSAQQAGPLYLDSSHSQGGRLTGSGLQSAWTAGLIGRYLDGGDACSRLNVNHTSCHSRK
jgi:hypothetical protein